MGGLLLSLFGELKRRNVFRVATAYVVAAWLIIQVVETILPAFGYGDAALRLVVIVLSIALVPALVFSWVFEITPEGLKREVEVTREQSITRYTGKKIDRLIMVLLALALGYFAFDKFVLSQSREAVIAETAREEGRTEALLGSFGDHSIAVLPFADMSPEGDQEYFADGMAEELLNLLAKIPELRVISRSSAFAFKGKDIDVREVSRQLEVSHVLEGSVRKAGDQVRVTAQLIHAETDSHLWSETYDREFGNVFSIQDDIAAAVVDQLKVRLLRRRERSPGIDPANYNTLLQARHFINQGTAESHSAAVLMLQDLLEVQPANASAWSELSRAWSNQVNSRLADRDEGYRKSAAALARALELEPENALNLSRLGWQALIVDGDLVASARYHQKALDLEPGNAKVLANAAILAKALGRLDQSIRLDLLSLERDPLNPGIAWNLAGTYLLKRQYDRAESMARKVLLLSPDYIGVWGILARLHVLRGDATAASAAIEKARVPVIRMLGEVYLAKIRDDPEAVAKALKALTDPTNRVPESLIAIAYARLGDVDQAFARLQKLVKSEGPRAFMLQRFAPEFDVLRDDPRWDELITSAGLTEQQLAGIELVIPVPD